MPPEVLPESELEDTRTDEFSITRMVLTELQRKQAAQGLAGLHARERVLLTACDFWSTVTTGLLQEQLSHLGLLKLRVASYAFDCIGSRGVVTAIRATENAMRQAGFDSPSMAQVQELAAALAAETESVDRRMADYATTLMSEDDSGART